MVMVVVPFPAYGIGCVGLCHIAAYEMEECDVVTFRGRFCYLRANGVDGCLNGKRRTSRRMTMIMMTVIALKSHACLDPNVPVTLFGIVPDFPEHFLPYLSILR